MTAESAIATSFGAILLLPRLLLHVVFFRARPRFTKPAAPPMPPAAAPTPLPTVLTPPLTTLTGAVASPVTTRPAPPPNVLVPRRERDDVCRLK